MNGHASADKDEANCRMHHSLLEQMGQLVDRERVLVCENDQLRAQLVEMKVDEMKKYDDLMVQYYDTKQYNMKREYEDDGLDRDGTSNNQVTVKTEWDDEEVKVKIKAEDEDDHNIFIKQEYVPAYIKTESSDEDVKEEIKVEDDDEDHDDDCGCDRFVVKKEEVSDDDDNSMQLNNPVNEVVQANLNQPIDTSSRDQLHTSNGDQSQSTRVLQSSDAHANMDQMTSHENASGHEQDFGDEMASHDGSVVASNEPSTSAPSNRVTSKQSTTSTARKLTKRKQSQPSRTVKRSKKTIENDEEDVDIANKDREESKIKVLHLNCTQSNCYVQLDSLDHLHDHLRYVHQLSPLQCFATNCNARFDNKGQIRGHIQFHSKSTRFFCSLCHLEYDSQKMAYDHWHRIHLTGQFLCNLVTDCGEVTCSRGKMKTHQMQIKHNSQSKHFQCTQPGCTASFAFKDRLKAHGLTHLDSTPFHCGWPKCRDYKRRSHLVGHIRVQHFGLPKTMKKQKKRNIVDVRDPNKYVRVVA